MASLAPRDFADARRLAALVPAGAGAIEYRLDLAAERIPASSSSGSIRAPSSSPGGRAREGGRFYGSGGGLPAARARSL